jgi:hypothetical protein
MMFRSTWGRVKFSKLLPVVTISIIDYADMRLQWDEFLRLGSDVPDSALDERINSQAPNKCCTLIYTVSACQSDFTIIAVLVPVHY